MVRQWLNRWFHWGDGRPFVAGLVRATIPLNDIAVYVIVDEDLPSGLKATQALHAAVELTYHHKPAEDWVLNHKTVIILEASLEYMKFIKHKVESGAFEAFPFIDTDLGPNITAIAFSPMRRDGRENRFFRDLPLAKFS